MRALVKRIRETDSRIHSLRPAVTFSLTRGPSFGYEVIISLCAGRRSGRHAETAMAGCGARARIFLPIRSRAASGPRSTGTKTSPRGACLIAAIFFLWLAKREKHPTAAAAGNPVLELSHRGSSRWRVPQA
jgi:hypothetical protein